MTPFIIHDGLVVAIPAANVDTDILVPKQYLKRVERAGLANYLFDRWRYLDRGQATDDPYVDCAERRLDPDFPLNHPRHANATVMLTRANFGCGSSREQAVWALAQWGIRALIAPSFGDIFFNNCHANGLLPITLSDAQADDLFARASTPGWRVVIDLPRQVVTDAAGGLWRFEIDPFRKACLLEGSDAVALTLDRSTAIAEFEGRRHQACPWLAEELTQYDFLPPSSQR